MAKILNSRQVQKHDTEENWKIQTDFIPLKGEIIVYDPDSSYPTSRQKIGDGITTINDLKFTNNFSNATYGFYIYSSDIINKGFYLSSTPKYNLNENESMPRTWTEKDAKLLNTWLQTEKIYFNGYEINSTEGIQSQFIAYDIGIFYTLFSKIDIIKTNCSEGFLVLDILPEYIDTNKTIPLNDETFEEQLLKDKNFIAFAPLSPKAGSVLLYSNQFQQGYGSAVGKAAVSITGESLALGNYSLAAGRDTAAGYGATAFGYSSIASANYSFTSGTNCEVNVNATNSHAEGHGSKVITGLAAHAEGHATQVGGTYEYNNIIYNNSHNGNYCHAEGDRTKAIVKLSHAEGEDTLTLGIGSHAEGKSSIAIGWGGHAEGYQTIAKGGFSHSEGDDTQAIGLASHTEGYATYASQYAHAEGENTDAMGQSSHAEGNYSIANGVASHVEGYETLTGGEILTYSGSGNYAHAEGKQTYAIGESSHAEGQSFYDSSNKDFTHLIAFGVASHAEGQGSQAIGPGSHAEGFRTKAIGNRSHAEGGNTTASGNYSHAEGSNTTAFATSAHAEGASTKALGFAAHAEGHGTIASQNSQHAQGRYNIDMPAKYAHIIGNGNSDTERSNAYTLDWEGNAWFAGGIIVGKENNNAIGQYTFAQGLGTIAASDYQHVIGKFNIEDSADKYLHIIGNGTNEENRHNAYALDKDGNGHFSGGISILGNQNKIYNVPFVLEITYLDNTTETIELIGYKDLSE